MILDSGWKITRKMHSIAVILFLLAAGKCKWLALESPFCVCKKKKKERKMVSFLLLDKHACRWKLSSVRVRKLQNWIKALLPYWFGFQNITVTLIETCPCFYCLRCLCHQKGVFLKLKYAFRYQWSNPSTNKKCFCLIGYPVSSGKISVIRIKIAVHGYAMHR